MVSELIASRLARLLGVLMAIVPVVSAPRTGFSNRPEFGLLRPAAEALTHEIPRAFARPGMHGPASGLVRIPLPPLWAKRAVSKVQVGVDQEFTPAAQDLLGPLKALGMTRVGARNLLALAEHARGLLEAQMSATPGALRRVRARLRYGEAPPSQLEVHADNVFAVFAAVLAAEGFDASTAQQRQELERLRLISQGPGTRAYRFPGQAKRHAELCARLGPEHLEAIEQEPIEGYVPGVTLLSGHLAQDSALRIPAVKHFVPAGNRCAVILAFARAE